MFLGLDISAKFAAYCFTENAVDFTQGKVDLSAFPVLLRELKPQAISIEYTGRLAETWIAAAADYGVPSFIMHCAERKAVNRIARQKAKTDGRDALTLARMLFQWHDPTRRQFGLLPDDLFTEASSVRTAWMLRAMLSSVDTLTQERAKAKQRAAAAVLSGNPEMEALWLKQAAHSLPEMALENAMEYTRKHFPKELAALLSIPGVGERTATYAIATLCPVDRFADVSKCLGYVGLNATKHSSADKDLKKPRVPHTGQMEFRAMLFMAALGQQRADNSSGELYRRLVARGKNGKLATVNVAAQILRSIFAVLKRGESREQMNAEPAVEVPPRLISQAEYARQRKLSRQRIGQLVKSGELQTEEFRGRRYIVSQKE